MTVGHPARFNPAKKYMRVEGTDDGRFAHPHDFNDAQRIAEYRLKTVADIWIKDGGVIDGGDINVNPDTGVTRMAAGKIYADGIVHEVAARTFTIPVDQTVKIGICVETEVVTYETDPDLKGQVLLARSTQEPGFDRLKVTAHWTWDGANECDGKFYGVYTVINGLVLTQAPPIDPLDDRLARYDRESNGHYIVSGWQVTAIGYDGAHNQQVFSVSEGTINVWGYKRTRTTSLRLRVNQEPDTNHIGAEPHVVPGDAGSSVRIFTRHQPVTRIISVTVLRQRTVTLTHGPYTGAADPLPDTGVVAILDVHQGGTTYTQGADYVLDGDSVDWRAVASPEPAPGSSYSVTYQYLVEGDPAAWDESSVTVANPVPSSTVIIDYEWSLPRIDAITVDRDGNVSYVKGQSSLYTPVPPSVALDTLAIAYITNKWGQKPDVKNVGTRAVPNTVLEVHGQLLSDLYDLVAQEKLRRTMESAQPTAKRGLFVDPLRDDAMRDQGLEQTGAIVDQTLRLPIPAQFEFRRIAQTPQALSWTEELVLEQPLATSSMKVNPYDSFAPLPAQVHLDPAVDNFVEHNSIWQSPITRDLSQVVHGSRGVNWLQWSTVTSSTTTEVLTSVQLGDTLRAIDILFEIYGFGAGEHLASVSFDGIAVTPSINPATGLPLTGDSQGRLTGIITVPAGVPVGAKLVEFTGAGGTVARGTFIGSSEIDTTMLRQVTTITGQESWADPLAQTFVLSTARSLAAVDIRFAAIGNRSKPVVVQIREVELGIPTKRAIVEARVDMTDVVVGEWTHVEFPAPAPLVRGTEYALVVMTDDSVHALATAAVGDFDADNQRYVTQQPYQIGVLLSSSNGSTWTPHNAADLAFRLWAARFTQTVRELPLPQPVALSNCTDLIVSCGIDEPSLAATARIKIVRADSSVILATPGQVLSFPSAISENVQISVVANGNGTDSPIVYPWLEIVQGTIQPDGTYISRAMPAGSHTSQMNVIATVETLLPGTSSITVEVGQPGNWTAMTLHSATPIGDGWVEQNFKIENYELADARIRITLHGTAAARPQARQIRANVTPDPINIITGQ